MSASPDGGLYVGFTVMVLIPNSSVKQFINKDNVANKHNVVRCLVGWSNDILFMDFSQLSSNIWT